MFSRIIKFVVKPDQLSLVRQTLLLRKTDADLDRDIETTRLFFDEAAENELYIYQRMCNRSTATRLDALAGHDVPADALETSEVVLNLNDTVPAPDHTQKGDPDDPLCWVLFFPKLKAGYHARIVERFKTHVKLTREEPGNLILDMYTVEGDPNALVVYELWRKRDDLDVTHFDLPFAKETGRLLAEAMDGDIPGYIKYVNEIID